MNYATNSVDNNMPVNVVYLDFTKAFDSAPHGHLIAKLTHIGFRSVVLNIIKSFLTDFGCPTYKERGYKNNTVIRARFYALLARKHVYKDIWDG